MSVVLSIAINGVLAVTFVALNLWALREQLEETFVSLAFFYGLLTISANALLAARRA